MRLSPEEKAVLDSIAERGSAIVERAVVWSDVNSGSRNLEGLRATLELLTPQLSSIGLGAELLDRLLAQQPQIDAVFFNNDDLALGALFRARQLDLAVPQRLAIAGFNDLPAAAWVHPALTTVRTTRGRIGQLAGEMLLTLMRGEQPARHCIDVGFELVLRDSA